MENTLKMFKSLDSKNLYKYSLEELSLQYKSNQSPQIIANVFIRLFDLIKNCGTRFFCLSNDDISSFSVYALDYCLKNYNNNNIKFTTYFYSVLYKKLISEQKSRTYNKRRCNFLDVCSLEICLEDESPYTLDDLGLLGNSFNINDIDIKSMVLHSKQLSDKEKECCYYIMESSYSLSKTDMAVLLNISRPTLYKLLKSIRDKLQEIISM